MTEHGGRSTETQKKKRSAWPLYLVLVAFAGLIGFAVYASGRARRAARSYVTAVRSGDLDGAYAMLSEARRAAVDREAFESALGTPRLGSSRRAVWNRANISSNGEGCAEGLLVSEDETRRLRVFLLNEDGALRIHDVQVYTGLAPKGPWRCETHR